jgi:hypothetical protein
MDPAYLDKPKNDENGPDNSTYGGQGYSVKTPELGDAVYTPSGPR